MEDRLIEILESFGYPVYRQGSMSDDDKYPPTFFTFWNNNSYDHAHYSDSEYGIVWDFDVNIYSNNPNLTYSLLDDARIVLKESGWVVSGRGSDIPSDEDTHTGRGIEVIFVEF